MISPSEQTVLKPRERADYGFARVRDLAFDAVRLLWDRRRQAGMKQTDLANVIGRDPAWVSRSLSAPGNWTLRTIGELVEAMGGEVEIIVHASEDGPARRPNFHAYSGYMVQPAGHFLASPSLHDSASEWGIRKLGNVLWRSPHNDRETLVVTINRALVGEVSARLRSVQYGAERSRIALRFFFDGKPDKSDLDSVASIRAQVAADFPDCTVAEEIIATQSGRVIPQGQGWDTAFARKEATSVRSRRMR